MDKISEIEAIVRRSDPKVVAGFVKDILPEVVTYARETDDPRVKEIIGGINVRKHNTPVAVVSALLAIAAIAGLIYLVWPEPRAQQHIPREFVRTQITSPVLRRQYIMALIKDTIKAPDIKLQPQEDSSFLDDETRVLYKVVGNKVRFKEAGHTAGFIDVNDKNYDFDKHRTKAITDDEKNAFYNYSQQKHKNVYLGEWDQKSKEILRQDNGITYSGIYMDYDEIDKYIQTK